MKQYQFIGSCVNNPFKSVNKLSEIIDGGEEVSKSYFLRWCDVIEEVVAQMRRYPDDYTFYRNAEEDVFFFTWSAREHFYARNYISNPAKRHKDKLYIGSCVDTTEIYGKSVEDIIRNAKEITKREFVSRCCVPEELKEQLVGPPFDFFYKSDDGKVYFCSESGIEHFFT